jgi:hypothetical protein
VSSAARRVAAWAADLRPRTILIAGWLVFLLYAYPGYMSSDSIDQLLDSRVGNFNDWHSPTLTEIWRLIGFAIAGPFGMLALQSVLLLCGLYVVFARVVTPRRAALLAGGLLVFPAIMTTMAVIWQDSQMAGFLVAGLAAVTSQRRRVQLAGLGLLVLATAMRPGAAFAVLPIIALAVLVAAAATSGRAALPGWRRVAAVLGIWAAVWLAALGLDAGLRSAATRHGRIELATTDLMGTLRYAPDLDDAAVRELLAGVALRGDNLQPRARAFYAHPSKLMTGDDRLLDPPSSDDVRDAIIAAEYRAVLRYPTAYLTHRWHMVYRLIDPRGSAVNHVVYVGFAGSSRQADAAAHMARHSAVQRGIIAVVKLIARTPLVWPLVYLLAAVVLLPLAVRRRHALATTLLVSGLAYELVMLVVAVDPDYALSHWMVTSTCVAAVLLVLDARARRRAAAAAATPA